MGAKNKKVMGQIQIVFDRIERIESILHDLAENWQSSVKPLSVSEISEYLKLSESTVYSKVSKREIPFEKVGKRLYFYQPEIDRWIKAQSKAQVDIEKKAIGYVDRFRHEI